MFKIVECGSLFLFKTEDCFVRGVGTGGKFLLGKARARSSSARCVLGKPAKRKGEFLLGRPPSRAPCKRLKEAGVYVLEKPDRTFYVGKSGNIQERLRQHADGSGASCAKGFVRRVPPMTAEVEGDHEAWERAETLARMRKHGISNVRGWMYTSQVLTDAQVEHAFGQVCERHDLCRKCGKGGHFAARCGAGKGKGRKRPEWAC